MERNSCIILSWTSITAKMEFNNNDEKSALVWWSDASTKWTPSKMYLKKVNGPQRRQKTDLMNFKQVKHQIQEWNLSEQHCHTDCWPNLMVNTD